MNIIANIKELRTRKGISVRKLADKTGINISNLSRIENGKIPPKLETVERILKSLDAELIIRQKDG